jgi:phosphohistidine phosphatase
MKTLYLVRHAKSSWKYDLPDHQRPLKNRGFSDAELVSKHVKSEYKAPQKIVSSDAKRAQTTAKYFQKAFDVKDQDFVLDHDLYDFSGQSVMEIIKGLDDDLKRVMIVGHNHAFTSIVNMLGSEYIDNLPTSGFVIIEFDTDSWSDITTGKTKALVFPRHLKAK